jgi:hypothetical protein
MSNPADSTVQNILPVQAYFNIDGSFNTFIGQGQPFIVSATESIGIIDTSVAGTFYPTFSPVSSGQVTSLSVTSLKLSFNPDTGVLSAPTFLGYLNGTSNTANNLANGIASQIPYQTGNGSTAFIANGSNGQVLTSNGTSAPSWQSNAASVSVSDNTSSPSTFYPLFANQTSGSITTQYTSSTKYQYVPSTGILTATGFSGSGAGLTSIPNSALTNSSFTLGSTSISLGSTTTTVTGLTSVTSTTFVGALTGNADSATTATTATTATNATNTAITDNTSSSSTWYPTIVSATTGNLPQTTSSTKLSFVPSTGTLSATVFSGSGASLTSIPNAALVNSAITINGTSTSLGGSISVGTVTSVTGTSPVVSSGGNTPAISMPAATTSVSGYLTSTDWNTFNGKGSGTVTSVSGTGTVSGISLSGTVTSSGNLTLGGTLDLSSPPTIGNTAPNTGKFSTLEATGTTTLGTTSTTYVTVTGDASYPMIKATGGTNTPLVLSPLGTGALQAQKTDSTATGGNARGANAVDWQTSRYSASQVASGTTSVIAGGTSNVASGSSASVVGGYDNRATGTLSFIGAGTLNTSSGVYSSISAGNLNAATGYYGFVGNGFTNSTTSNSAVTTQSGTMNATTAVTLSGSNANIKVGQYITGTSIGQDTYVAAISGTALTLSKVASGSSTSTLSFFTPHGVVVGGGNNQATGSYSFIGGGGDAGTAANRNVASGAWSTIGGGNRNTASGLGSFIGGNGGDGAAFYPNTASGVSSAIVCGTNNTLSSLAGFIGAGISNNNSSSYGFIGAGSQNTVNGFGSAIVGGYNGNTRSITGNQVFPACVSPIANASGVSQAALLILATQTTDATATVLRSESGVANTTNQVILPNNSAYFFTGEVVSGVTGGGNTKGWTIEGVIKRGAGVGTTALVGSTVTSLYADAGAATWTIALAADTTNGGLRVTFTGQAATTIRTVCQIRTTEMTY